MQKKEHYKRIVIFLAALIIWGAMTANWAIVWYQSYGNIILRPFGYKGNWLIIAVYGILLFCFSLVYGAYRIGYYKFSDVIFSNFLTAVLTNVVTYLQTCLVGRAIMDVVPFIWMTVLDFIMIWIWSIFAAHLYLRLYPPYKMLVVYGGSQSAESLIYKMNSRAEKYDICEAVSVDQGLEVVFERIKNYDVVIICDVDSGYRNTILKYCYSKSIRVYLTPKISDMIVRGADKIHLFDTPLLLCRSHGLTFEQQFFKRALDIVISCFGLILASPFMLATAIVVKLYDGGSVLYKQKRLTLNGKIFEVYKFRSMIVDAEKDSGACLSSEKDDRVTPVGSILRKIRFDELPQFFNILKGDMSVVGPRPERPEIAEQYESQMPEFSFRLKVKAGLTGYAQVLGKYNTTPYDKLKMDLMYIENYSMLQDIKLILMTFKILFLKESTEGVPQGTKTAIIEVKKKNFITVNRIRLHHGRFRFKKHSK